MTIDTVDPVAFFAALGGARDAMPRYLKRMLLPKYHQSDNRDLDFN